MDAKRVALIEAGNIANLHAAALHALPETAMVAVTDRAIGRARALGEKWGIPDRTLLASQLAPRATPNLIRQITFVTRPIGNQD